MILKKQRIGVSLRVENISEYNEKRDALSHDWIHFLKMMDVIPILIPNNLSNVKDFLDELEINGIILSGGDNMGDDKNRDKTEKEIIDHAINSSIPILGVCRGMQVLNNYFHGTLTTGSNPSHVCKNHIIKLREPIVSKIFETDTLDVNSYHNNTINQNQLGKNLVPFAISKSDETVEGFYHETLPIIGVMWHPERDTNVEDEINLMKIFQNKLIWEV